MAIILLRNLRCIFSKGVTYDKGFLQKSRITFLSDSTFLSFLIHPHDPILAFPGVDLLQGIGQVLHFSAQGNIIARLNRAIRVGTRLFSTQSKAVGRVVDIFGPTKQPYASVKPEPDLQTSTLPPGTTLYMKAAKGGVGKRQRK